MTCGGVNNAFSDEGDPDDPSQLKALFDREELRRLYGQFSTARNRNPKSNEPFKKARFLLLCIIGMS